MKGIMRRVLITGVAGYIGGKLAAYLAEKPEVEQIVGTDIRRPMGKLPKLTFYEQDVRSPLQEIFTRHSIDTVIHAAYVLPPLHNESLMEDVDLNGTRSVLSSCAEAGVSHILYLSSATAYGFHPDNDLPLTEGSPLPGNEDLIYSKTKRVIEGNSRSSYLSIPTFWSPFCVRRGWSAQGLIIRFHVIFSASW